MQPLVYSRTEFSRFADSLPVFDVRAKPWRLVSGLISHAYGNWRTHLSDAWTLHRTAGYVNSFLQQQRIDFDMVVGVPSAVNHLADIINYQRALESGTFFRGSHPLCQIRKRPKEHGDPTDKYFVGNPRGKVVILEDVTTSGESIAEKALPVLRNTDGVEVVAGLVLTHRKQDFRRVITPSGEKSMSGGEYRGVEEILKDDYGLDLHWMSEGPDLIQLAFARKREELGTDAELVKERLLWQWPELELE